MTWTNLNLFYVAFMVSLTSKGTKLLIASRSIFLVACYITQYSNLFDNPSNSLRLSHFTFFMFLQPLSSQLLLECSSDRKYSPCSSIWDWGSSVSGFVINENSLIKTIKNQSQFSDLFHSHCTKPSGTCRDWVCIVELWDPEFLYANQWLIATSFTLINFFGSLFVIFYQCHRRGIISY